MSDDLIRALNRAFGSKTGARPRFTAEAEGDDYLFGRAPIVATDREVCTCASAYGNFIGCKLHGIEADDTNRPDGSAER